MLNKKCIEQLKWIHDKYSYSKDHSLYGIAPITSIQEFLSSFDINKDTKFNHFQEHLDEYVFTKEIKLINTLDHTNFEHGYCYNFIINIEYNSIQYEIKYYESVLLPYGYIVIYQSKNLTNIDNEHAFIQHLKEFNNSLIFLDDDAVNVHISNASTQFHKEGDVTVFNALFNK
jgi:hypothetical protein